jgi:hypothetical protein
VLDYGTQKLGVLIDADAAVGLRTREGLRLRTIQSVTTTTTHHLTPILLCEVRDIVSKSRGRKRESSPQGRP